MVRTLPFMALNTIMYLSNKKNGAQIQYVCKILCPLQYLCLAQQNIVKPATIIHNVINKQIMSKYPLANHYYPQNAN